VVRTACCELIPLPSRIRLGGASIQMTVVQLHSDSPQAQTVRKGVLGCCLTRSGTRSKALSAPDG
jgi:hypothetical protein